MKKKDLDEFNNKIEVILNEYMDKISMEEMVGSLSIWQQVLINSEKDEEDY